MFEYKNNPFFKRTFTGNDKWIIYNNMEYKMLWGENEKK